MQPILFVGHGSPMIALEDNAITKKFSEIGNYIIEKYEKPRAILSISAHWYTHGIGVLNTDSPRQIYDMYGFPKELYEVKYEPAGSTELASRVHEIVENSILDDSWGIDHGTWTVLKHIFPMADIPTIQLSVSADLNTNEIFKIGESLKTLRDEDVLILGSGNIVHNLRLVDWNNENWTDEARIFDEFVKDNILSKNFDKIVDFKSHPLSPLAAPTDEHFLPLIYVLGAAHDLNANVFNNEGNLGWISMSSYIFE